MNLKITEFHKFIIQKLNETNCPYLVRDFVNTDSWWSENHLNLWVQYPAYPEDIYVIQKALIGRPLDDQDAYCRGGGQSDGSSSFNYIYCDPNELRYFQEEFFKRTIVNYDGVKINFLSTDSVSEFDNPSFEFHFSNQDFLKDIASLNLHNVRYLVIGESVEELFSSTNDFYTLWVDTDRASNLRLHNAFQFITGNAPGIRNFLSPMSIKHNKVLWTNYDEHLNFEKFYNKRHIFNVQGVEVNFIKDYY